MASERLQIKGLFDAAAAAHVTVTAALAELLALDTTTKKAGSAPGLSEARKKQLEAQRVSKPHSLAHRAARR
jgi:hypothetical protein